MQIDERKGLFSFAVLFTLQFESLVVGKCSVLLQENSLLADEERIFFSFGVKKKMLDANKVKSHRHANNNEKRRILSTNNAY